METAEDGTTIVLTDDIELGATIEIYSGKTFTIDLNGKTINALSLEANAFNMTLGNLTIKDSGDTKGKIEANRMAFRIQSIVDKNNEDVTVERHPDELVLSIDAGVNVISHIHPTVLIYGKATLNSAGILTGHASEYATLQGNGTSGWDGAIINVTGGEIIATKKMAIYFPQEANVHIKNTYLEAPETAVEAKGGNFIIDNSTLKTTAVTIEHERGQGGHSTTGFALAVVDSPGYPSQPRVTVTNSILDGPVILVDDDEDSSNNAATLTVDGVAYEFGEVHFYTAKLEDLIVDAEAKDENLYTPSSYEILTDAILNAEEFLTSEIASQAEVSEQVETLQSAIEALVARANTTDLEAAITEAENLVEEEYTVETYTALTEIISTAKTALNDPEATQVEIDDTLATLNEAIDNLVRIPAEKTALEQTVAEAEEVSTEDYTPESVEALNTALASATAILEDTEATQAEVDRALKELET